MIAKYIFRMDDITPNMDWDHFWQIMDLFRSYNVKPLLGIVPDNKDAQLIIQNANPDFWDIMRVLQRNGMAEFAQHGYHHILGNKRSEFVGLPYEVQFKKIKAGQEILRREGIYTDIWMAPAHTFDATTLNALADLGFSAVTDGIALYPFIKKGLTFVPQQLWRPRYLPFGVFTVCMHINENYFYNEIENFLKSKPTVISFTDAKNMSNSIGNNLFNMIFKFSYSLLRFIRTICCSYSPKKLLRIMRNFLYDIQFGGFLGGIKKTPFADSGAYDTMNSDYAALPYMFTNIHPTDVLVDVGCGKGRVINWWLKQGFRNKIVGLELDHEVAQKTAKRLCKYNNVSIIAGDAIENVPSDGTVFYLFNPFNQTVMGKFKNKLERLFSEKEGVQIIYYNCLHVDVFKGNPNWIVEEYNIPGREDFHKVATVRMRASRKVIESNV